MTSLFSHAHWSMVAGFSKEEIKAQLISGYPKSASFEAYHYPLLESDCKVGRILDFGCGIGRNFPFLKTRCKELIAFDIAEMIEACREHTDCDGISVVDRWNDVRAKKYDIVAVTLVFQHIEDNALLETLLLELSKICDYLYITTRCWKDGPGNLNIMRCIDGTGLYSFEKANTSHQRALDEVFPSGAHFDLVLRSKVSGYNLPANARAMGEFPMEYTANQLRHRITMTQLFTPNYDHWAYTVLENKRKYCEKHGYTFNYRRGLYETASDRHPSWHRVPLILELFENSDSEWIFWSDIDSLIMRDDVRLEWLMEGAENKDLIVPNQGAGIHLEEKVDDCICFGQFFIRNCDWSREFLKTIWEFVERPEFGIYRQQQSWEQEAVNYIFRKNLIDFLEHALITPNRLFNSFYHTQYKHGDFLIHFAGDEARGPGRREALIQRYSDKAIAGTLT